MAKYLLDYEKETGSTIDVLVMNSCLWDVNRWGPMGPREFKINCEKLLKLIPRVLSENGLFLWLTTPPGKIGIPLHFTEYFLSSGTRSSFQGYERAWA